MQKLRCVNIGESKTGDIQMNTLAYKGKHRKEFSLKATKRSVKITVYLADKTIVTKVDKNGNVETTIEPII